MIRKRRSLKHMLGVALVVSLAFAVVGVASASATTQHWYVGGTKLAEGTPTGFTMKNTTDFTFRFSIGGGVEFVFKCTSQNSEGVIENPTGGGAGNFKSAMQFTLSGCTRVTPLGKEGCQIQGKTIYMTLSGTATEFESKSAVTFTEWESNGKLFSIWMEGENCIFKGNGLTFYGSFTGIANNPTSSLEFTKASSAFSWGGKYPASFSGTSKLETTTGKTVTVAP
jgi:hypothetical protein